MDEIFDNEEIGSNSVRGFAGTGDAAQQVSNYIYIWSIPEYDE